MCVILVQDLAHDERFFLTLSLAIRITQIL
jgi:hypothetical protein